MTPPQHRLAVLRGMLVTAKRRLRSWERGTADHRDASALRRGVERWTDRVAALEWAVAEAQKELAHSEAGSVLTPPPQSM